MATRNGKPDENKENKGNPAEGTGTPTPSGSNPDSGTKKYPAYLEAALRISSSYPLGAPVERPETWEEVLDDSNDLFDRLSTITGGMVLDYVPTYGFSDSHSSPLSRAVAQQFNVIRKEISGNRPYEAPDHMIYRMCVASMRQLYNTGKRAYGLITQYSATNLYRPRHYLEAMGLDADDYINNAPKLYQFLHTIASSLKPFPTIPVGAMDNVHEDMNLYIYTDGEIDSTQAYIFRQVGYYSYEVVDEAKGVTPLVLGRTVQDFIDLWNRMYSALQNSTDVYIISSDIARAFKDAVVWELTPPTVDYVTEIKKLDSMLTSIMNATVVGSPLFSALDTASLTSFRIEDSRQGYLKCTPEISSRYVSEKLPSNDDVLLAGVPLTVKKNHLNFVEANPSAESIMNAVRFMPVVDVQITKYDDVDIEWSQVVLAKAFGSTVLVGLRLFNMQGTTATVGGVIGIDYMVDTPESRPEVLAAAWLQLITCCDWHPPVVIANFNIDNAFVSGFIEDIQNYTPISDEQLTAIHSAMILNDFGF